jgi:hypothetical protein
MNKLTLNGFFERYLTHETRFYNASYNPVKQIFAFRLDYTGWIKEQQEKGGPSLDTLIVIFNGVRNFNICKDYSVKDKQKLEEMDDIIFDITLETGNTITIVTDETNYSNHDNGETIIKFVATDVSVDEIKGGIISGNK